MISEKRVQIIGSNDIICPICIKMDNPENISDEENPDDAEIYKPPKFIQVFGNWIEYAYHILEVHTDSDRAEWAKGCLEAADKPLTRPEKPVVKLNSKPKIKPQIVVEDDIEIEPILEPIEKVETKKAEKSTPQVDNPWLDLVDGYEKYFQRKRYY